MKNVSSIAGSMLTGNNHERLDKARLLLSELKELKLRIRHEKNFEQRHNGLATWDKIHEHFLEEVDELSGGISAEDTINVLEEIADCINCLEIMAICIACL